MRVEEVRERARNVLPGLKYQEYGDSPTIKSYTDWGLFERTFVGEKVVGRVEGVEEREEIERFEFEIDNRITALHFSSLPSFLIKKKEEAILGSERGKVSVQHLVGDGGEILDTSDLGPKSVTMEFFITGERTLVHKVHSSFPHFSRVRIHLSPDSSLSAVLSVEGGPVHVRYDVFLERGAKFFLSGVSFSGRSDVITNVFLRGDGAEGEVKYLVLAEEGGFVVHRGKMVVGRETRGARARMDSSFLTLGGLAVSAPFLEVYTDAVEEASHRSRDLSPTQDQLFYLRSRGLTEEEAKKLYVDSLVRSFLSVK